MAARPARTIGEIYAMIDPRTGEPRYIGMTTTTLRLRLASAVSQAKRTGSNRSYHKDAWVRQILADDLRPVAATLEIVSVVDPEWLPEALGYAEKKWIAFAKEEGWRLTNIRPGGLGPTAQESRDRLAKSGVGRTIPPDVRKKISETNKLWKRSPEHLEALHAGRRASTNSPEHNEAIRQAKLGKPLPEETKKKISESRKRYYQRLAAERQTAEGGD